MQQPGCSPALARGHAQAMPVAPPFSRQVPPNTNTAPMNMPTPIPQPGFGQGSRFTVFNGGVDPPGYVDQDGEVANREGT